MLAVYINKISVKSFGVLISILYACALVAVTLLLPPVTFAAEPLSIPLTKEIRTSDDVAVPATTFTFTLDHLMGGETSGQWRYAEQASSIGVPDRILNISANQQTGTISDIFAGTSWPNAGTYAFALREMADTNSAEINEFMTYSDQVFIIIVRVFNDPINPGGFFPSEVAIFNNPTVSGENADRIYSWTQGQDVWTDTPLDSPGKVDEIRFINSFELYVPEEIDPELKIDPPVVKTVQGNPRVRYDFTFRLESQTPGAAMPVGSTGNAKEITIRGSGRAQFGTWTHSQTGTFIYTVREISRANSSYRFDATIYTITDTVRSENGNLVVDRVITNDNNRQVSSFLFINTYIGADVEIQETTPTVPGGSGASTTRPIAGPKTGDYADPALLQIAMVFSAVVTVFAVALIYVDRKSEKDYGELITDLAVL
ncbi:MAG: hypothetical protein FWD93_04825 [Coriobacteriia bacterium]|nr:hypothetical protein [Coriobacteriia bacterium]